MTRWLGIIAVFAFTLGTSSTAAADPCGRQRPSLEWSTWTRLGASGGEVEATAVAALMTEGVSGARPLEFGTGLDLSLGADLTLGIGSSGDLRVGPWVELQTTSLDSLTPQVGIEILAGASPEKLDMFWYVGEGQLGFRAGVGRSRGTALPETDIAVAAVTYGYRAPWQLFRPTACRDASRYMIGARFVVSVMRSLDDPEWWMATAGIEIEPVGALRFLLGIRSWY